MDINSVTIVGRLGRDPEVRFFADERAVANFSMAVNGMRRGDDQPTHWIDVTVWGKTAEICGRYLTKGQRVGIIGRLEQDRWEDRDGGKRSKIKVVASQVQFLETRGGDERDHETSGNASAVTSVPPPSSVDSDDEPPF